MAKGRKTGGRRPGIVNKRTLARRDALATAAAELRAKLDAEAVAPPPEPASAPKAPVVIPDEPEWFRGDAHALLRMIYTDPRRPMPERCDAAKAAIRYERPALTAVAVQHSNSPSRTVLASLSTDQLKALLLEMDADVIAGQAIEGDLVPRSDEDGDE